MKIRIQNRSVYHKFVEVEIEIDKDELENWKLDNGMYQKGIGNMAIQDYLIENDHLYSDKIDKAMDETSLVFGTGLYDFDGMDDAETDSEWRFDVVGENYGGHL